MLQLDIQATLGKIITPQCGIPEQEMTALRTPLKRLVEEFLSEREKGNTHEWAMDPYRKKTVDRCQEVAKKILAQGVQTIVWIGIGGSGLGPKVIQELFEGPQTVEFILVDTIDPSILAMYRDIVDWKKAAIVVASKSGNTLETMSAFYLYWDMLEKAVRGKAHERVVAITDPSSGPLHDWCEKEEVEMLPIPPNTGGRYSVFSPVGLLALALLKANVAGFVRGAKEMDTLCQSTVLEQNPAAQLAAVQFLLEQKRGYNLRVIMPYSQRLASLGRWNQQLIAESLGKNDVHNPIPMAAVGTQDQHSLLQQWMEGPRNSWHLFLCEEMKTELEVPHNVAGPLSYMAGKSFGSLLDACYQGTSKALTTAKRPHVTITLTRLDEFHLGQLFFCFMAEVVLLGKLYRIDPYGQPGVELGKTITRKILTA